MTKSRQDEGQSANRPAPRRPLAADPVFDALAGAILRGKYQPGSALPPERELSALFNVSRLIVRQALHRLREMGLVSGGQGGQNTVLDPDASIDPHIVALTMQLAPEKTDEHDVVERQLLAGTILLELAQMRITDDELDELDEMVKEMEEATENNRQISGFDTKFWTFVAATTRNTILLREARWWFEMLRDQPERRRRFYDRPELRLAIYRGIIESLKSRSGQAAAQFLAAVHPVLESREP
jgi:GntR family transcriptional repressor for pyruvate dehydrogenase complex